MAFGINEKGRVSEVPFTIAHRQPKLIAIDTQPDDDIVQLGGSGQIQRLPG